MIDWKIGCSGFVYRHWKPIFYPEKLPQKNWFHFYSAHFKTVELNVTFYRFPTLKLVDAWYEKSPPDFIFTVKAPRIITHFKKLHGTEDLLTEFYEIIGKGFKEKLGVVLFQFPPLFSYTEERLEKIVSSLNGVFTNVVEFRHPGWWNEKVYNILGRHNITFCGMSHPLLPQDVIHNCSVLYYRLHGLPDLYKSPYTREALKDLLQKIKHIRKIKSAYIYFNNDIDGSAIRNSQELLSMI